MKITLKRVLLCGICLVGTLFFLLMFVTKFEVQYGPKLALTVKDSLAGSLNGHPFEDVYSFIFNTRPIVEEHNTSAEHIAKEIDLGNKTLHVFAVMGLIAILVDVAATVGAFFMPSQKAARKLLIPVKVVVILVMFVLFSIGGGSLNANTKSKNVVYAEAKLGGLVLFLLIGIFCFIGALIAAGVTKDKVLVDTKKK